MNPYEASDISPVTGDDLLLPGPLDIGLAFSDAVDATRRNLTGAINQRFEEAGLRIVAQKRVKLGRETAEAFYDVHRERPFFDSLCTFMTSGPVVVQVLEGEDAIAKNREVMGATNPAEADEGTIRKDFAESIEANSVHGSDAPDTAAREIGFFFSETEIVG